MVVLFFRYLFELLLIPIAAVISLLPAHRHLRYRAGRVYGFSACVLLLFCGLGSWLCARMSWTANAVLLPCLILFFLLYCLVVDYSIPKRLFCFFNAAMLTGFSTMFVFYLLPPFGMEQNIIVSSFSESLVTLGVALLLFLVFFRPLSRWLPELMDNPSLDRMWLNLQVVPILLTALVFLMTPQRFLPNALPDFILPELLLLIPVGTFALYGLLWRSSRELLESSRLRKEVDLLEMEKKRAESFQYYVENTRTMRHDFRQHLLVIDQLAKSGDNEKLLDYLGQFTAC